MRPLLAATLLLAAAPAQQPEGFDADAVRRHVLPGEAELRWRALGWRDTFGAALLEADDVGRPVLLWAMNGHPLGCT